MPVAAGGIKMIFEIIPIAKHMYVTSVIGTAYKLSEILVILKNMVDRKTFIALSLTASLP